MALSMSEHVARLTERFTTDITRVRLEAVVHAFMFPFRRQVSELAFADLTLIRFFSRMRAHVRPQRCLLRKPFLAHVALEWSYASVH